jgi:hypothetical protein
MKHFLVQMERTKCEILIEKRKLEVSEPVHLMVICFLDEQVQNGNQLERDIWMGLYESHFLFVVTEDIGQQVTWVDMTAQNSSCKNLHSNKKLLSQRTYVKLTHTPPSTRYTPIVKSYNILPIHFHTTNYCPKGGGPGRVGSLILCLSFTQEYKLNELLFQPAVNSGNGTTRNRSFLSCARFNSYSVNYYCTRNIFHCNLPYSSYHSLYFYFYFCTCPAALNWFHLCLCLVLSTTLSYTLHQNMSSTRQWELRKWIAWDQDGIVTCTPHHTKFVQLHDPTKTKTNSDFALLMSFTLTVLYFLNSSYQ